MKVRERASDGRKTRLLPKERERKQRGRKERQAKR